MTDAFYNLFLLTQLLTAIAIVNSRNERHVVRRLGVAGALTGLTASVKPSGVLLGVPLFLVVSVYRLGVGGGYKRTENGRAFMIGATAFLILSVTIIYVLNPTFWPSGLADVWRLLGFRDMLFAWDRRMAFQDSGPGIGEWSGSHFVDIHRSIFVAHSNATVTLLFFLGLLLCARRSLISMRHGIADVFVAPVAYFVCNYMLLICFLRLNWDRYYLPTEISMRVLAAIGIAELAVVTLRRSNVRKGTTPIGGATEVAR